MSKKGSTGQHKYVYIHIYVNTYQHTFLFGMCSGVARTWAILTLKVVLYYRLWRLNKPSLLVRA